MANYTPDEIQAVVEKLVLSSIRRPYDTLGVRRTDVSFTDVQEAAAGVFLLYPNAPFYVLYLGAQRLDDSITTEAAIIESLLDALEATGRNVLPVEDVSTLFNAQAALQALASAAARQAGNFTDITKAPAYVRFNDNVGRFLGGPGQNVKQAGAVVQTPQQARGVIPGLVAQLQEAHEALVARVAGIAGGIEDYNTMNLPTIVSTSVLSNAARLVGEDADKLNVLSPSDRLTLIRQTVLDVLSVKAVVQTFGSFSPPSDFYSLDGLGAPYSDGSHLAAPAVIESDAEGTYGVVQGVNDELDFILDGGTPLTVTLQPSVMAELAGLATDDRFVVGNGNQPIALGSAVPNNNVLKVKVDNITYPCVLTVSSAAGPAAATGTGNTTTPGWYGGGGTLNGTTLTLNVDGTFSYSITFAAPANIAAVLAAINAVTNVAGAQHRVNATNSVGNNLVLTCVSSSGTSSLIIIGSGSANAVLGFTNGQTAVGTNNPRTADQVATDINAGLPAAVRASGYFLPLRYSGAFDIPAGVNQVWSVPGGATNLLNLGVKIGDRVQVLTGPNAGFYPITNVTATTITVSGTTVLELGANCEIGPVNRALRITCIDPVLQLPLETKLSIVGDTDVSRAAAAMLGLPVNVEIACTRTSMEQLAQDIRFKTQAIDAGTVVYYFFELENARARSEPSDPTQVTFARVETIGDVTYAGGFATYTVTSVVVPGTLRTGHLMVLRDGPDPNTEVSIDTINGQAVFIGSEVAINVGDVIVGPSAPGTNAAGVRAEFGPSVSGFKYRVLDIVDGPNAGRYTVAGPGQTSLDILLLNRALPFFQSGVDYVSFTASYGFMLLQITSKTLTVQSRIQLAAVGDLFLNPMDAYGTTPWMKLPSIPRGLQGGDILELHETDYKTPSSTHTIESIDIPLKVIGLSENIPSNISWQFTPQPVPFARLRVGTMNSYGVMKAQLDLWLKRDVNRPAFFINFNRLVNPLLVNENPTAVQVGNAINELKRFYAYLLSTQAEAAGVPVAQALDSILALFTIQQVDAVDVLLRTFTEKGSDRATDLLLSGAFSTFFNLTIDGASYSGAFQEALRDVARADLPVRRFNRAEAQNSRMISQTQSPDYEYTAASVSESLQGEQVNPPTPFGEPADYGRKS